MKTRTHLQAGGTLYKVGEERYYLVAFHDSLLSISQEVYNNPNALGNEIYAANRDKIGPNPNRLKIGTSLRIP